MARPNTYYINFNCQRCGDQLSKLKHFLPKNILRCIYLSLILPHFSYCSIIWSGSNKSYLNSLIVLQKKAIRHICNLDRFAHTSPLFSSLNLLKFPDIIKINIASFTFKCINSNVPNNFKTFFTENSQIHNYNTRQRKYIQYFPCR